MASQEDLFLLPGWNIVGCSYNVLNGYYADTRSTKYNLFQFPGALQDLERIQVLPGKLDSIYFKPKSIVYRSSLRTWLYSSAGNDIQAYTKQVNNRTKVGGSYNFFAASVETEFGSSKAENSELEFSKVQFDVSIYTLHLPLRPKTFLDPVVRADIDESGDLYQLFDTYGTHFVSSLVMGGRAVYTSTTNKYRYTSSTDLGTIAEMSYKTLVGSITASEEFRYKDDVEAFNQHSESKLETVGGDPKLGGEKFPQQQDEWAASVGEFLALADFLDGSLVGIWTLASNTDRENELLNFYPKYCQARQTQYTPDPGPYLRTKVAYLSKTQFTDSGSGARMDLIVCIPDFGSGWYYLGQVALPGKNREGDSTLLVRELFPGSGVLAEVVRWEPVWNDSGSGRLRDFSLWRGVPANPADYVVLSDFFRGGVNNQNPPTREETQGIVAVRKDCLVRGEVDSLVWSDAGTRASKDAAVWNITPGKDVVDEAIPYDDIEPYYVSAEGYQKPTRPVYCLRRSAVVFQAEAEAMAAQSSAPNRLTYSHTKALASRRRFSELL